MRIAGCGCALGDFIYDGVAFDGEAMRALRSQAPGDGGILPGGLVFADDLERHAGAPLTEALAPVLGDRQAGQFNVGGPAIVALTLAAQLLADRDIAVDFFGTTGNDETGARIRELVDQTPLGIEHYHTRPGNTARTIVLSDPEFDCGHGERAFVNEIGASAEFGPEDLPPYFFEAGLVLFGATAIVPTLHEHLSELIARAKAAGSVVVVTTVYDFISEQRRPGEPWPLGQDQQSWRQNDLLVADHEEALRLSGTDSVDAAMGVFQKRGLSAAIVTEGPRPVTCYASDESLFASCDLSTLPVSRAVADHKKAATTGDTTGCGDNFAGGVLAAMACQMAQQRSSGAERADDVGTGKRSLPMAPGEKLDLPAAVAAGICAGGAARFHLGGLAIESRPGERRREISGLYADYRQQVADVVELPIEFLG